jgi:hypothetical protein
MMSFYLSLRDRRESAAPRDPYFLHPVFQIFLNQNTRCNPAFTSRKLYILVILHKLWNVPLSTMEYFDIIKSRDVI